MCREPGSDAKLLGTSKVNKCIGYDWQRGIIKLCSSTVHAEIARFEPELSDSKPDAVVTSRDRDPWLLCTSRVSKSIRYVPQRDIVRLHSSTVHDGLYIDGSDSDSNRSSRGR